VTGASVSGTRGIDIYTPEWDKRALEWAGGSESVVWLWLQRYDQTKNRRDVPINTMLHQTALDTQHSTDCVGSGMGCVFSATICHDLKYPYLEEELDDEAGAVTEATTAAAEEAAVAAAAGATAAAGDSDEEVSD
jgi:hypothetical protein